MRIDAVAWLLLCLVMAFNFDSAFTPEHTRNLSRRASNLFLHAWDSYIDHGFPADEVTPFSCMPHGPDLDPLNFVRNDALANVSLTILDNIDSLIVLEKWDRLEFVLDYLHKTPHLFDQNRTIQVFELSIRALGGLLLSHLLLTDTIPRNPRFATICEQYDGFLLRLAIDLGERLLPAYKTSLGIPLPRINLATGVDGVPSKFQHEACTAGAGTPVLEFTLLSRLSGNPEFEHYAQRSLYMMWDCRLDLDLMPMTIDPIENRWKDAITGIGASVDSFYEHVAKLAIVFGDDKMWQVFATSYKALRIHLAMDGLDTDAHMYFPNVDTNSGHLMSNWIDSLGAFWGGLLVLAGQLDDAIRCHLMYVKIWNTFDLVPERWIFNHFDKKTQNSLLAAVPLEWWPLRPEFIETTYYLFRATNDPFYLQIGERILHLFESKFRTQCGFAGYQDVRTGARQDRMESFVLGETLKYLCLLFDTANELLLHSSEFKKKNWVFSTEAHPLWYSLKLTNGTLELARKERLQNSTSQNEIRPSVDANAIGGIAPGALIKHDPWEKLMFCQVNPLKPKPGAFMASAIFTMPVFVPDHTFRNTLVRPAHLSSHTDGTRFELTKLFYDRYTLFSSDKNLLHLQSPRISTTEKIELKIGAMAQLREVEVLVITHNRTKSTTQDGSYFMDGDLWVPQISTLKLWLERLSAGTIDRRNVVVTEDYVESIQNQDAAGTCLAQKEPSVFRLTMINGVAVEPGKMVWSMPFETQADIGVTSNSLISLQGIIVENWAVWYG